MTLTDYYGHPAVRARIAEYCGAATGDLQEATCRYLLTSRGPSEPPQPPAMTRWSPGELAVRQEWDFDIFRSLWERDGLLVALDVEYANFDYRGEAFVFPERAFGKLEAIYLAVEGICAEFGLPHLTLVTGQGYHFSWHLGHGRLGCEMRATPPPPSPPLSTFNSRLSTLDPPAVPEMPLPQTLLARYRVSNTLTGEVINEREGRLFAGVGMLAEWLLHLILRRAAPSSPIPVVCSGLEVGNRGPTGREAASIDLSAYADPLDRRYIRCAFSTYQKHRALASLIGEAIAQSTPPRACVLRQPGDELAFVLAVQHDLARAAASAEACSALLPDGAAGMLRLLASYQQSQLARFHEWFYQDEPDPPERWPEGYDRLDLSRLPPCVALPLSRPNDLLLKPTNLLNITRVLWARGWRPRHIGGLIRSKYERDWGWGAMWFVHDAATRAEVQVRILAGLVAGGTDDLRDFNCISHQEKGYCPQPFCGHSLGDYRNSLLSARP